MTMFSPKGTDLQGGRKDLMRNFMRSTIKLLAGIFGQLGVAPRPHRPKRSNSSMTMLPCKCHSKKIEMRIGLPITCPVFLMVGHPGFEPGYRTFVSK